MLLWTLVLAFPAAVLVILLHYRWKFISQRVSGRLFVGPGHAESLESGRITNTVTIEGKVNPTRLRLQPSQPTLVSFVDVVERMCQRNPKFDWEFRPAWPLLSALLSCLPGGLDNIGHLQTVLSTLRGFPLRGGVLFERQAVKFDDGGQVFLDWLKEGQVDNAEAWKSDETPVMIVLHGICGGSAENYVQHVMMRGARAGFRPCCFNFRGAADTELATPYSYSAGQTHDIRHVVRIVHHRFPRAPLTLVGFSLGANVTTKFLGEEGGLFSSSCSHIPPPVAASRREAPSAKDHAAHSEFLKDDHREFLAGAVVISNLFDLEACSKFMHETSIWGMFYSRRIANNLRNYYRRHSAVWDQLGNNEATDDHTRFLHSVDTNAVLDAQTVREFDELATRRLFGFDSVDHYYQRCSSKLFLSHVKVPLLCLSSNDDPLAPGTVVPTEAMDEYSWPVKRGSEENCPSAPPVLVAPAPEDASSTRLTISEQVGVALTHTGGHVAWIEQRRHDQSSVRSAETTAWSDTAAIAFLESSVSLWREKRGITA